MNWLRRLKNRLQSFGNTKLKGVIWLIVGFLLVSVVSAIWPLNYLGGEERSMDWPDGVPHGEPFHTILYTDEIRPASSDLINITGVIYGNGSGIYGLNLINQYFGGDTFFEGDTTTFINNVEVGENLSVNETLTVTNYIYVGSLVSNHINSTNIYSDNISANYYCDKDGTDCYNITELVSEEVSNQNLSSVLEAGADASGFSGNTTFGGAMDILGAVDVRGMFTWWNGSSNYLEINYDDNGNGLFAIQSSKSIRISGAGNTNLSKLILKANEIDVGLICGDDETLTGNDDGVLICTEDLVNDSDHIIGNEYPTAGNGIFINESKKVNVNESWLNSNYIEQNEYPNLDTNYTNDLTTTTEFGGDVNGTYDNLQVEDNSHKLSWDNITGIPLDIKDGDNDTWWGLNEGYIYNSSNSLDFNESMLNATIDARADGYEADTIWNITGYVINDSGRLNVNESMLNAIIEDLADGYEADTHVAGDGIYLTNDSTTIYFNESRLNATIEDLAGDVTDVWVNESGDVMKGSLTFYNSSYGLYWNGDESGDPHIDIHDNNKEIYVSAGGTDSDDKVHLEGGTIEVSGDLNVEERITAGCGEINGIQIGDDSYIYDDDCPESQESGEDGMETLHISSSDSVSIASGGNVGVYVKTDGSVGIGTTDPGEKFTVNGVAEIHQNIYVRGVLGISNEQFRIHNNNVNTYLDYHGGNVYFRDEGIATKFFIEDSSGNVGIGTTNPGAKLDVNGTINVAGEVNANSFIGSGSGLTEVNADTLDHMNSTDFVAVAGDTMTGDLTVNGDVNLGNSVLKVGGSVGSDGQVLTSTGSDVAWEDADGGKFIDGSNPAYAVYTGGNVGIGTTSPDEPLHIKANRPNIEMTTTDNDGGISWSLVKASIDNDYGEEDWASIGVLGNADLNFSYLWFGDAHNDNWMVIKDDGNVGIGTTSPSAMLEVAGDLEIGSLENRDGSNFFDTSSYTTSKTVSGISSSGTISYANIAIAASQVTSGTFAEARVRKLDSVDTRSTDPLPQDYTSSVQADFKYNTADGLSDGGTYHGVLSYRPYGDGIDDSGGPMHQLGFTSNKNLWMRTAASDTTWNSWVRSLDTDSPVKTSSVLQIDGSGDSYIQGNVGIGTTSPGAKLEVNGGTLTTGPTQTPIARFLRGQGGDNYIAIYGDASGNYIVADDTGTNQKPLRLQTKNNMNILLEPHGTGKVGIGTTSPLRPLTVSNSGYLQMWENTGGTADSKRLSLYQASSSAIYRWIATDDDNGYGSDIMSMDLLNNRVGIGTTNPGAKLEVAGTTIIDGDLTVGGAITAPTGQNVIIQLPS